jgi:cytochrome c biogenesis protein CcdA
MMDPLAVAVDAVSHGDTTRVPLVALAGLLTSIGPCVAPRYVALAALLHGPRRMLTVAAFVAGLMLAYAALGFAAGLLGMLAAYTSLLDAGLAAALGCMGLLTLLRANGVHAHAAMAEPPRRLSAVFSLGAASAFVLSPCCTPVVAAVVGFSSVDVSPLARIALLCAFALGHAAPLLVLGPAGSLVTQRLQHWTAGSAPAIVSGTLMLALAAYYGLLV